jgi:hypothetical protein
LEKIPPPSLTTVDSRHVEGGKVVTATGALQNISCKMIVPVAALLLSVSSVQAFAPAGMRSSRQMMMMSDPGKIKAPKTELPKDENDGRKKMGFNYDPSNYKDSNSANYRRLSDQLAAVKAEEDQMKRERDELIRKEQMAAMLLKKENETFWNTAPDTIVGTPEKYFIPPQVLGVIDDLDNQLIGLKPVKEKMRRYAAQMLSHKIRDGFGVKTQIPPLHHVFTGNPGTGKTTVAMKMGELYKQMGFINSGHTVQATRADLVGQYIGHTGPKTKEMITRSFGGILFIDEVRTSHTRSRRAYPWLHGPLTHFCTS